MNYKLSLNVYKDFTNQWIVDARIDGQNEKREFNNVADAVIEASCIVAREKLRWNC